MSSDQRVTERHLSSMDMSIVASPLVLWSLCLKLHTGFSAVLNYDNEQLDVCSSCKTALSSQHSTDLA